jgi:tetratricopeptide (TPR) repeat protein
LYEESLSFAREVGHKASIANMLANLGSLLSEFGDFQRSRALLEEALQLAKEQRDTARVAFVLLNLGELALRQEELALAAGWCRQSLEQWQALEDSWGIVSTLHALAHAVAPQRPREAARLFGAEAALRETSGIALPPVYRSQHDRALRDLRSALGEATFGEAWAEGQALPLETAVSEALALADELGRDAVQGEVSNSVTESSRATSLP